MAREYPGDDIFDALVTLGWNVNVQDNGFINASSGGYPGPIVGELKENGSIEWPLETSAILKDARIRDLKARAEQPKKAYEQTNPEYRIGDL